MEKASLKNAYEFVCMSYENVTCDKLRFEKYLHPCELEKIKNAGAKRKIEFFYGRLCAKLAYAAITGTDVGDNRLCVLNDSQSAPFFEDGRRFVSITHGEGLAAAIVTEKERLHATVDVQKMLPKHTQVIYKSLCEREKIVFDSQSAKYGRDFLAAAIWVAKEALSKLLLLGLSVFDALEVSGFEQKESFTVRFANFAGLSVIIRPYGDFIFGFAVQNKNIGLFDENRLSIKETPISAVIQNGVFNKSP